MHLLLDTHTFIWWTIRRSQLSEQVSNLLLDRANTVFLSLVSVWEMQIKIQLGKLTFNLPLSELLLNQQQVNDLQLLSIKLNHILALESLPNGGVIKLWIEH